jgi:sn-glycerol 3-phosphate transport system permease protein
MAACVEYEVPRVSAARRSSSRRGESHVAALFLGPSLLLLTVFAYGPLLANALLSLTSWNLLSRSRAFVALGNYDRLLADPRFPLVLVNTAIYAAGVVSVSLVLGLALALLLDRRLTGHGFYRTVVFAPYVTSLAAVALVWIWVFDPRFGLVNGVLRSLLLPTPGWLSSPGWALLAVCIVAAWHTTGYMMVIFLAGLQNVPPVLHEAARIDGAGSARAFWYVTLPLLSPVALFLAVTGLIVTVQLFDVVSVMTHGGPVDSTNVLAFYLYHRGFELFELGYASAIGMVLFSVVMILTVVQLAVARYWVHYG